MKWRCLSRTLISCMIVNFNGLLTIELVCPALQAQGARKRENFQLFLKFKKIITQFSQKNTNFIQIKHHNRQTIQSSCLFQNKTKKKNVTALHNYRFAFWHGLAKEKPTEHFNCLVLWNVQYTSSKIKNYLSIHMVQVADNIEIAT